MRRKIDSCEAGKSPDALRLIRATGKENPERSLGYLLQKLKLHQLAHARWRKPCKLSPARKQAALFLAQRMGGAGMAAVCTGILASSGERGLERGMWYPPFPPPRGKRQIKNIRAANTPDKTKLAANLLWLAANLFIQPR